MMTKKLPFLCIPMLLGLGFLSTAGGAADPAGSKDTVLVPRLVLESPDKGIRDIAVSPDGSIFTFDYGEYKIRKYDRDGRFLLEFGGTGSGDGQFTHLTGLRALRDRLLAVDSVGLLTFDLDGRFLGKQTFAGEIIPNFAAAFEDGRYLGFQILASELKAVLTLRSSRGEELDRLGSYDLKEFFPGLKAGEKFFLNDDYARNYLYAWGQNGDVYWAASDALRIFRYRGGTSKIVFSEDVAAAPFPETEKAELQEKKARIKPPLFLYVPEVYPLLWHLAVGPGGDLWIYIKSQERTGFLRLSGEGISKGFASVSADFDVIKATVRIFGGRMYFILDQSLYAADLPGPETVDPKSNEEPMAYR
jgi:hypothetical protein